MDTSLKNIPTKKPQPENTDNMSTSEQQKMTKLTLLLVQAPHQPLYEVKTVTIWSDKN